MKILILTIEPPLPFSSASSKWFYVLLTELRARGHEVTYFSACSKKSDLDEAHRLFPDLRLFEFPRDRSLLKTLRSVLRPYSYMFSKTLVEEFQKAAAGDFDVIHVEQLWAGWIVPEAQRYKTLMNVHYFMSIDLEETKKTELRDIYEYQQSRRAEAKLIKLFPFRRYCTERLLRKSRELLKTSGPVGVVIPFSVDQDLYPPLMNEPQELSVGMIASMGWYPGKSAALNLLREIFPHVQKQRPECILRIAGWGARSQLSAYVDLPAVRIEENIQNVEAFFKSLTVFVYIPSRGSGMKMKVLEALLFGIPVVSNAEGLEGLPAVHGIHAFIAEDDERAIEYTLKLLGDAALREQFRINGRALVAQHCDKDKILDQLEKTYKQIQIQ